MPEPNLIADALKWLAVAITMASLVLGAAGVWMKILDNRHLRDAEWTKHVETQLDLYRDMLMECEKRSTAADGRANNLEQRVDGLQKENFALTRENLVWARQLVDRNVSLNADAITNTGKLLERAENALQHKEREGGR